MGGSPRGPHVRRQHRHGAQHQVAAAPGLCLGVGAFPSAPQPTGSSHGNRCVKEEAARSCHWLLLSSDGIIISRTPTRPDDEVQIVEVSINRWKMAAGPGGYPKVGDRVSDFLNIFKLKKFYKIIIIYRCWGLSSPPRGQQEAEDREHHSVLYQV